MEVQSNKSAGVSAVATVEEDVRLTYYEALRNERTYDALRAGRLVAEAVCSALAADLPDDKRRPYTRQNDLHARISILEQLPSDQRIVPGAVIAALRTLQAYGNYASHYDVTAARVPNDAATKSAMASLGLVVDWFLNRGAVEEAQPKGQEPRVSPPPPGLIERWQISRRAKVSLPTFKLEGETTPDATLGAMFTFYSQCVALCERICREVLAREAGNERQSVEVDQLPLRMEQLAELRPARVPRSVASDVAELWRRRAVVSRALKDGHGDVEHLLEELAHRNPTKDVVRWFRRQYLRHTHFERLWWVYLLLALGWWLLMQQKAEWQNAARAHLRSELTAKYCSGAAEPRPAFCVALDSETAK